MSDVKTQSNKARYLPWLIWFLGAFFYFYENLLQVSPSVMVQDLMRALSIDAGGLGLLAGAFFCGYAPIQIPAGVLADHYNVRLLLATAISFCVVGCILFVTSHGIYQAALGRLLVGIGSGFAAICSMKLATLLFPAKKFPFLIGLMVTFGMTGSIMGGGPLAVVVESIGWRQALYALILLGIVLAVLVVWLVHEKKHTTAETKRPHQNDHFLHGLIQVLACRRSWSIAGYGGLMFAPTSIFGGLWGVPFIMQAYQLDKPTAASLVSLLFLGWVIGGPLTGLVAGQFEKKRPTLLIGSLGALTSMIIILYFTNLPLFMLGLVIFSFGLFSSCFLPSFSIMKEIHDAAYSGAALGFMNTANMIGGLIGLPLVGWVLNRLWDGNMLEGVKSYTTGNYVTSLSLLPIMMLISIVLLYFVDEEKRNY
ncbi:MAG: MFS transporter [Gammaproteobacteria bacterium]|nr:MFS transporter [Gammaproteobacteria bacterium]